MGIAECNIIKQQCDLGASYYGVSTQCGNSSIGLACIAFWLSLVLGFPMCNIIKQQCTLGAS